MGGADAKNLRIEMYRGSSPCSPKLLSPKISFPLTTRLEITSFPTVAPETPDESLPSPMAVGWRSETWYVPAGRFSIL